MARSERARNDLLVRDRRPRHPARLQGGRAVPGGARRARRAAWRSHVRRGAARRGQPRQARRGHGGREERGDRQACPRGLRRPRRSLRPAPVHAHRGAAPRARVALPRLRRALRGSLALLAVVALLTGAEGCARKKIYGESTSTITAMVGEQIIIELASNPTTGYT